MKLEIERRSKKNKNKIKKTKKIKIKQSRYSKLRKKTATPLTEKFSMRTVTQQTEGLM